MKYLLISILCAVFINSSAQEFLVLKKKTSTKKRNIVLYQKIAIKDVNTGEWTYGKVTDLSETQIQLDTMKFFNYNEISAFRYNQQDLKTVSTAFIAGGVAYTGILLINGVANGDSPVIPEAHGIAAASMFGFGWIVRFLSRRTFTMEKYRLEYIRLD